MLRVAIIASGRAYQEAAAWAAATYAHQLGAPEHVCVLLPQKERRVKRLLIHANKFGFAIERFPFRLISEQKFTSQLKCQAFHYAVSRLNKSEALLIADAD